jgi:hypothetical protein
MGFSVELLDRALSWCLELQLGDETEGRVLTPDQQEDLSTDNSASV